MPDSLPALSVILLTPGPYEAVARTLQHLERQTIAAQVEVVLITPSRSMLPTTLPIARPVHSVKIVECGPLLSLAHARTLGVHAATSPILAICENHSYPRPE